VAVLIREAGLLFIAEAHVAGRATAGALLTLGGEASAGHHDRLPEALQQGLVTPAELGELTVISTVRNHYDALVTWWLQRGRGRSFIHFLQLMVTMPGRLRDDRLYWKYFDDSDLVLRYEDIERQLGELTAERMGRRVAMEVIGDNRKGDYRRHHDEHTRGLIATVFEVELSAFGYGFEPAEAGAPVTRRPAWRDDPPPA